MTDKARQCAYHALRRVWEQGAYSNIVLAEAMKKYALEGKDRAFCSALVYGAAERLLTLDYLITTVAARPAEKIQGTVLTALRLGMLQIFFMKVPDMAACSESVALLRDKGEKGFVNGVLRNACRRRDELAKLLETAEDSVKYSLSPQICQLIEKQYPEEAKNIMASFYNENPLCLRVNPLKTSVESLKEKLNAECVEGLPNALTVKSNSEVALEAVSEGLAIVQGLSSQTAVALLDAKPNMTVVDCCCCPGGKTLGAAMDMQGRGKVYAMDLHANKLSLVKRTAEKLGITVVELAAHDGRTPKEDLQGVADRVICDVPCSGIGAIKGRPEIRYKDMESTAALINTQRAIVRSAYTYLKVGGRMVYSTCTINKEENEKILHEFVAESGAKLVSEQTVLPNQEGFDGFYMALVEKV